MVKKFLEGNEKFVNQEFLNNQEYYKGISKAQNPEILWIGCSDSRVPENVITATKPGSIFVHRNVANIVSFNDLNIAAILEYAIKHLKIMDIVVCGHENCGGIAALLEGVEENYIADWLIIAKTAKTRTLQMAKEKKLNKQEQLDLLVEENVKLQIEHLKAFSLISNLKKQNKAPRIHGWVYSLQKGKIKVVVDGDE